MADGQCCQGARARSIIRGLVSLSALIVLWAGVWLVGDTCVPRSSEDVGKEIAIVCIGIVCMLGTNVFFSAAYMDRFDRAHSLRKRGRDLRDGREQGTCEFALFYFKSAIGMVGTILFWSGIFNLLDIGTEYVNVHHRLPVQLGAAAMGSIVVLFILQIEDQATAQHRDALTSISSEEELLELEHLENLPPCVTAAAYTAALLCNTAQVVLWWGVETLVEAHMPDKWWAPATLFVGGIIVLRALDRLDTNLGLVDGGPKGGRKHTQSDKVQSAMGQTLLNASELIAVCLIWTGCEWFIWDGFLFHETCTRDSLYALVGFAVLLCTGTFVSLAGTVSPMGVYGRVHQKLQNNEEPLDLDSPDYSEDASFWEPAWPYERIDMDWHFSV